MIREYKIEQINVSDEDYKLTSIYKNSFDKIKKGDLLFSYESSKADFDVESESDGYIYFDKKIKIGDIIKVGSIVSIVSDSPISEKEIEEKFLDESKLDSNSSKDQIFTKKALLLIDEFNINKKIFSKHKIINESIVRSTINSESLFNNPEQDINYYYSDSKQSKFDSSIDKKGLKKLAIIGAGKAALQLLDAIVSEKKYYPECYYDNNKDLTGKLLLNIPIIGQIDIEKIKKDYDNNKFDEIIISFSGNINQRKRIYEEIVKSNIPIANVIHPSAVISNFCKIGFGNIIFANVRIGPFVEIKNYNVISAYCSIEHHNFIDSNNTFGPAVITSGSCTINNENKFGTGIFIEPRIKIGNNCLISSGVILRQDVPDNSTVKNLSKIEIKTKN